MRLVKAGLAMALIASLLSVGAPASAEQSNAEPQGQLPLTGSVGTHDPTLYKDDTTYYVSATGGGILSAPTMNGPWTSRGTVPTASWTRSWPGLNGGLWAPSVHRVGDTFYYYYAVSNFGTNTSAIGLKTTKTPGNPASYIDHGAPVITSGGADPGRNATYNAIDPAIQQDANGAWWLVFGSHFAGIYVVQLGADLATTVGEPRLVAHRGSDAFPVTTPGCPFPQATCPNLNRIEGASMFKRGEWYYLMAAWDWCCRGNANDNTYKIIIGRSKSIDGPFLDKNGVNLAHGGGSIILNTRTAQPGVTPTGLYRAPGAPETFIEDGVYWLSYHAYRPGNTLGIRPMNWQGDWPYFNEATGPYALRDGGYYRLINQDGIISNPNSLQNPVASNRCLTATPNGDVVQSTCDGGNGQVWRLEDAGDGFWRFRSADRAAGHCLTMANGSGTVGTDVVVSACADGRVLQQWSLDDTGHGFHRATVKGANLSVEVENSCAPTLSYNCDGVIGTNVVGGFIRNGDHTSGNLTQAAKWPAQQWQLSAAEAPASGCTTTITGRHNGPLTVTGTLCVRGGTISGPVTVRPGAALDAVDATFNGPVSASGAAWVSLIGGRVSGPVSVTGTTGGVALIGAQVSGPVSLTNNTGVVPAVVSGGTISGPLSCTGNTPAPTADGTANTVRGPRSGQCANL
ncbi:family 43 glycosylhydrolase [Dactylosporangium sp. NPDC050588]|uniref:family 43 glycosylhydrolase n=1 Tax=Dactylosporangium sp. NPDC050588 TaxID=3157211 RepID=UPI0033ECA741